MKPRDAIVGSVCFGEAPTEALAFDRDNLKAEIRELQSQRDQLTKTVGLPEFEKSLKRSIGKLTDKKNKLESDISTMIVNKATIVKDGVAEATKEAYFLKDEVERALKSLKSGLFLYEEKFKTKMKELEEVEDKVGKANGLLDSISSTMERKKAETREEVLAELEKIEKACSKFEQEKLSFQKEQATYHENLKVLEKMSETLDAREKLLNELEASLNIRSARLNENEGANEKRFSEVQESQRLAQAEIAEGKEKVKKEQDEMVRFRKALLERELKVEKRESDLDHNWTVFLSEKERLGGKAISPQ